MSYHATKGLASRKGWKALLAVATQGVAVEIGEGARANNRYLVQRHHPHFFYRFYSSPCQPPDIAEICCKGWAPRLKLPKYGRAVCKWYTNGQLVERKASLVAPHQISKQLSKQPNSDLKKNKNGKISAAMDCPLEFASSSSLRCPSPTQPSPRGQRQTPNNLDDTNQVAQMTMDLTIPP
ncbi:hypothetical protein LZ32DRAFT_650380 [Colletotrichum eremochloae]|nr:hypothetical protein LZ32DRAFT_650380 [Colletotrichum eremochloae]